MGQPTIRLVEPETGSEQRPGFLYRHFDVAGSLLYVGKSVKHLERLAQHRATAHWYDRIATVTIEKFSSEAEALAAEDIAIKTEHPECNIASGNSYNSKPPDEVLDRVDLQTAVAQRIAAVYREQFYECSRLPVSERERYLRQAEFIVMAERLRNSKKPSQELFDQGMLKRGRK